MEGEALIEHVMFVLGLSRKDAKEYIKATNYLIDIDFLCEDFLVKGM